MTKVYMLLLLWGLLVTLETASLEETENTNIQEASTTILIEAEGGAAEWQGARLGYFDKTLNEENSRPMYFQRSGNVFLYHNEGMHGHAWIVGSTVGSSASLYVTSTNLTPPSNGWGYSNGSNLKTDDNTLRLITNPPNPSSTCNNINVSSTGPAATARGSMMGLYHWEEEWLNGRKLYVGGEGNKMYLRVPTGKTSWAIDSSKDSTTGGIQSGRATTCPCTGAGPSSRLGWDWWRYEDDGWHEDSRLQVTCV